MGELMHTTDIATPAGIRQAHPIHSKAPWHLGWGRQVLRGLTYIVTDKGPQPHVQWMMGLGRRMIHGAYVMAGHRKTQHIYSTARG